MTGRAAGEVSQRAIFSLCKLLVMVFDEQWKSTQFRFGGILDLANDVLPRRYGFV